MTAVAFTAPARLEKSQTEFRTTKLADGKTYADVPHVFIIASDESLDQDGDQMLSEAFTAPVREFFLKYGIFDWDHITVRGGTDLEQGTAIIGTPTDFYEERDGGAPVQIIRGYLHPCNPYVDSTIAPALRSGSDRIAVSVGGKVLATDPNQHGGKSIRKIWMNHLAFTPAWKSVNLNTRVKLEKSIGGKDLARYGTTAALLKSLEAGSTTDMAAVSGGQALQPQSMEGGRPVNLTFPTPNQDEESAKIANRVLFDVVSGHTPHKALDIYHRALDYGMAHDAAEALSEMLVRQMGGRVQSLRAISKGAKR